jgi:hypothetical protein
VFNTLCTRDGGQTKKISSNETLVIAIEVSDNLLAETICSQYIICIHS